jgi:glycosyltransferase involved in cell wall biosynthesis
VIPNETETATFVKSKQSGPVDLLYLGSILEYEGLQLLLEALSQIENSERFRLTIVGGGRYETTLKNISLSKGLEDRVTFTGRVAPDQVAEYYKASDLVVVPRLPNRVSQLVSPLKPLEAMMYSRVCLASNVGPIADLIEDGKTGYLFEAGDVGSLVAKLNEIYMNRAGLNDISKTAMKMVKQDRNWTHLGTEMTEILARLAEPS